MKTDKILSDMFYEWSNLIRLTGNQSAHDHNFSSNKEQAEDTFAFFEAILDYMYNLKLKYETIKRREKN
jgi:hypothetical protein